MNRLGLALLPLAAAVALAGCSGTPAPAPGGGGGGASSSAPAPAPRKDLPAPGSEVDINTFGDALIAGVDGVKTVTVEMTTQTTVQGQTSQQKQTTVTDRTDPSHPRSHSVITSDGQTGESVFDGDMYYSKQPGATTWTKRDLSKPSTGGIRITPDNPGDLSKSYTAYKEALTKVVYVGQEKVDGVDASHYTVTMNLGKASGGSASEITAELYVDGRNRPVQTVFTQGPAGTSTTKLGKFDEPVTITIPADATEE
ncbi:hypothetical protein G7070_13605 [Propioniciclava coleopterorum]|uniref:Lipoprotein LprG n=1 Tax=Propioniciclava coleopterorum TaxID=2714937 RepID=A0A6G7Y8R8_9ACTN|nr:hypothetical protein [Propioniciclava coleopterorum]QIK73109.1 hypothetical protein G7070_13605 [Propioniciclava coleopterorum]